MRPVTVKTQSAIPAKKSRVFIVDDHPIVRKGLSLYINGQADMMACGDAPGGLDTLKMIEACRADFVMLDISLSGPDGIELLKILREKTPDLPVLVFSLHDESIYAERALRAGANGYITKHEPTERVVGAIRHILRGEVYLSDQLTNRVLQHFINGPSTPKDPPLDDLSDRELEVFRLIGDGHGTRQIATELHISVKTVESYQAHIKAKLSLRNARELVQHAIEWSLSTKKNQAVSE